MGSGAIVSCLAELYIRIALIWKATCAVKDGVTKLIVCMHVRAEKLQWQCVMQSVADLQ